MNDESQSYKVSATSHIACVKFTINTTIYGEDVHDVLADGVLYNTQRAAASKAVKALGGGKRNEIPFTPKAVEAVRAALTEVYPSADLELSEYVKGSTITKKFVVARDSLTAKLEGLNQADSEAMLDEIADRAGFTGDIHDEDGEYTTEFLVAVDARIKKLAKSI